MKEKLKTLDWAPYLAAACLVGAVAFIYFDGQDKESKLRMEFNQTGGYKIESISPNLKRIDLLTSSGYRGEGFKFLSQQNVYRRVTLDEAKSALSNQCEIVGYDETNGTDISGKYPTGAYASVQNCK